MAAILDIKVTFFPRLFFSIITSSISIKNHIQLGKSTLQVVTELDFLFLIYFFFKDFFYHTDNIWDQNYVRSLIVMGYYKKSVLKFHKTLLLLPVEYYYYTLCEVSDISMEE